MERKAAEEAADKLNREHPERDRYVWAAGKSDEAWAVYRSSRPAGGRQEPRGAIVEQPDQSHIWTFERIPDSGT